MNKYIGLTIGPIYPTLKKARSTRELWGASYLFSSIFRKITCKLKDYVILPYVEMSENTPIGLYPDMIILKQKPVGTKELCIDEVHKAIVDVFYEIAEDVKEIIGFRDVNRVINQIQRSIQIHAYELEIPTGQNIIFPLYNQLDILESFNQLPSDCEIISDYFSRINESKLYTEAGWNKRKRFPSLFDISAYSLSLTQVEKYSEFMSTYYAEKDAYEKTGNKEAKRFLERFDHNCRRTFGSAFKPFHKYFALVHADGDNMGRIVSSIGNNEQSIINFSKALFDFGKDAGRIISNYGGLPIYIGGDDLLFFAPLANKRGENSENILALISELDKNFKEEHLPKIVKELRAEVSITPSFSYGISVNYHKYPLKESLEYSYKNLHQAKSDLFKTKNSLVITLQKHSGQQIEAGFEKSDPFYLEILKFIDDHCFSEYADEYNSFRRKCDEYHPFLKNLKAYNGTVSNFIQKNFDHDFSKGYWKDLLEILIKTYSDTTQSDMRIQMLYFAIRFIHFINSETNE